MALKCENCGKGVMYGHNVSHSKRRTRKIFKPNLHSIRVKMGAYSRKMRLCTKCTRLYRTAKGGNAVIKAENSSPKEVPATVTA